MAPNLISRSNAKNLKHVYRRLLLLKNLYIFRETALRNVQPYNEKMSPKEIKKRIRWVLKVNEYTSIINSFPDVSINKLFRSRPAFISDIRVNARDLMEILTDKILDKGLHPYTLVPNMVQIARRAVKELESVDSHQKNKLEHKWKLEDFKEFQKFKEFFTEIADQILV